ncbi:hypothetical protein L2E82_26394 [Cichorium intybus]|uniref:Uncharacterized protein n=1 Tax=Cichorium intybus TaxID=13427 RepID=A0ACB9CQI8_CICIN|nr:hypothetical protein L2E82_26394 [Cichorium intybus]
MRSVTVSFHQEDMKMKKMMQWRDGVTTRVGVILPDLTSGAENLPICFINDVDSEFTACIDSIQQWRDAVFSLRSFQTDLKLLSIT